jgi:hypothetical protein
MALNVSAMSLAEGGVPTALGSRSTGTSDAMSSDAPPIPKNLRKLGGAEGQRGRRPFPISLTTFTAGLLTGLPGNVLAFAVINKQKSKSNSDRKPLVDARNWNRRKATALCPIGHRGAMASAGDSGPATGRRAPGGRIQPEVRRARVGHTRVRCLTDAQSTLGMTSQEWRSVKSN